MFFLSSDTLNKMVEGSYERKIMAVEEQVSKEYPGYTLFSTYSNHAILYKEGTDNEPPDFIRIGFSQEKDGLKLESCDQIDLSKDIISEDEILPKSTDRLAEAFVRKDDSWRNQFRGAMLDLIESDHVDFDYVERVLQKLEEFSGDSDWKLSDWQIHLRENAEDVERMLYEEVGYYRRKFAPGGDDVKEDALRLKYFLESFICDVDKISFDKGADSGILDEAFVRDLMKDLRESVSVLDMTEKLKDLDLIQKVYDAIESNFSDFDIAHKIVLGTFK